MTDARLTVVVALSSRRALPTVSSPSRPSAAFSVVSAFICSRVRLRWPISVFRKVSNVARGFSSPGTLNFKSILDNGSFSATLHVLFGHRQIFLLFSCFLLSFYCSLTSSFPGYLPSLLPLFIVLLTTSSGCFPKHSRQSSPGGSSLHQRGGQTSLL